MARGFGSGVLHGALTGALVLVALSLMLPLPIPDLPPPGRAPLADAPSLAGSPDHDVVMPSVALPGELPTARAAARLSAPVAAEAPFPLPTAAVERPLAPDQAARLLLDPPQGDPLPGDLVLPAQSVARPADGDGDGGGDGGEGEGGLPANQLPVPLPDRMWQPQADPLPAVDRSAVEAVAPLPVAPELHGPAGAALDASPGIVDAPGSGVVDMPGLMAPNLFLPPDIDMLGLSPQGQARN